MTASQMGFIVVWAFVQIFLLGLIAALIATRRPTVELEIKQRDEIDHDE